MSVRKGIGAQCIKKEDKFFMENYRPITILPYVNKILEKLVGLQIAAGFESCMYENSTADIVNIIAVKLP